MKTNQSSDAGLRAVPESLAIDIIADVLIDTQGIQPRALEHTRMVVCNRIEKWLAAASASAPAADTLTIKELCYFCETPLVDGKPQCQHPQMTPDVMEVSEMLQTIEFCDHFCCGMPAKVCQAVRLTLELRKHAATAERPAGDARCPCGCGQVAYEHAATPHGHTADYCTCKHCMPATVRELASRSAKTELDKK